MKVERLFAFISLSYGQPPCVVRGLMRGAVRFRLDAAEPASAAFSLAYPGQSLSWWPQLSAASPVIGDGIVATSAVDLATLKGCFPALQKLPSLLYLHENQFAYPRVMPNA